MSMAFEYGGIDREPINWTEHELLPSYCPEQSVKKVACLDKEEAESHTEIWYRQLDFLRSEEPIHWSQATALLHSPNALILRSR